MLKYSELSDALNFHSVVIKIFILLGKVWENISSEAKDLITKMLTFPAENRITAKEAYAHRWLTEKKFNTFKPEVANSVMISLKNFHVHLLVANSQNTNYNKQR